MVSKINLKDSVNEVDELFLYKRVGTLNKDNTGGTYKEENLNLTR